MILYSWYIDQQGRTKYKRSYEQNEAPVIPIIGHLFQDGTLQVYDLLNIRSPPSIIQIQIPCFDNTITESIKKEKALAACDGFVKGCNIGGY